MMDDPTPQTRPPKADWTRHKDTIIQLYLDEGLNLKQLAHRMEMDHGFIATTSQFEFQLKSWRVRKNLRAHEWKPVLAKLDSAPPRARTRVLISNRVVPEYRIHRARRHCNNLNKSAPSLDQSAPNEVLNDDQISFQIQGPDGTWNAYKDLEESPSDSNMNDPRHHRPLIPTQAPKEPVNHLTSNLDPQSSGLEDTGHITNINHGSLAQTIDATMVSLRDIIPWEDDNISERLWGLADSSIGSTRVPAAMDAPTTWSSIALGALDNLGSNSDRINSIMLSSPIDWLNDLPSRKLGEALEEIIADHQEPDNSMLGSKLLPDLGILCFTEEINREHEHSIVLVHLSSLIQATMTFLPVLEKDTSCYRVQDKEHALLSSREVSDANLLRAIVFSMINGLAGLDSISISSVVKFLDRFRNMNLLIPRLLQLSDRYAAKAFAENLLRSAIAEEKESVITQILAAGLLDDMAKCHFLEMAVLQHHPTASTALLDSIIASQDGELERNTNVRPLLSKVLIHHTYSPKWAQFIQRILKAGVNLTPEEFECIACPPGVGLSGSTELCYPIATNIQLSQHAEFITAKWFYYVAMTLEDETATELVRQMLLCCQQTHASKCIHQYQRDYDWGVITAAKRGSYNLVHLQISRCRSLPRVLSAAIRSGNESLISLVMAQQPGIIKQVHCIEHQQSYPNKLGTTCDWPSTSNCNLTSALAEALRRGNTQLIHSLEQAGVLDHFDGKRFHTVIAAAIEINDLSYVQKLIDHYMIPNQLETVLCLLVKKGWNEIAMELLDAGAPVNEDILHAAVVQRNNQLVREILNADIVCDGSAKTLLKAIEWGDRSIITDLLSTFAYRRIEETFVEEIYGDPRGFALHPSEVKQYHQRLSSQYPPLIFAILFKGNNMLDFLLESKLATKHALTECLMAALLERNRNLLRHLIDQGADPLNERILQIAAEWRPDMLHELLMRSCQNESRLPRGLRTEVLKGAVRQSHQDTSLARNLIRGGQIDLLDTSCKPPATRGHYFNLLGEAILLSRKSPGNSLEIVKALLDAGCKVNDIVQWSPGGDACFIPRGDHPPVPNINQTALLEAIETMNQDVVRLLLDRGANVNEPANFAIKRTPLQKAAEVGSLELVRMLISYKADVNGKAAARSGGTALQMAAIGGNCNIAAELLIQGALLHTPPSKVNGRWPLEGAAEHGRLDMIEFLWKAHLEVHLAVGETGFEEKYCLKAMELAQGRGHFACRDLIAKLSELSPPQVRPDTIASNSRQETASYLEIIEAT
ncbi:hypothetical protein F4805DRAFT_444320 [Annulohypoxylon moriforme]|nr:hypothetical protein F4805DRAFT_444320 [Annulohypoxylon moriforme]